MDVNIEIDIEKLLSEVDLNDHITVDLDNCGVDTYIENMLDGYISDRENLCCLGKVFQQAIRITVREMMADPEC